jgi:DNA-binding XRE family transcriptional regulator
MGRSQSNMPDNERASEQGEQELAADGTPVAPTGLVAHAYEDDPEDAIEPANTSGKPKRKKPTGRSRGGIEPNNVRKLRQEAMMSKAELARRAGVSPLTIDRVEAGCPCRMDTKRKILEALGLKPSARAEVWPDIDTP